jgi:Helix-turn-helix domain
MTDTVTASPYLGQSEAAAYLHLAPRTMANQRSRGEGPRWHKAGGRVLYLRSDLESYVRSDLR